MYTGELKVNRQLEPVQLISDVVHDLVPPTQRSKILHISNGGKTIPFNKLEGQVGHKEWLVIVERDPITSGEDVLARLAQMEAMMAQQGLMIQNMNEKINSLEPVAAEFIVSTSANIIRFLIRKDPQNRDESDFTREIENVDGLKAFAWEHSYPKFKKFVKLCNQSIVKRNSTAHPTTLALLDARVIIALAMFKANPTLVNVMGFEHVIISKWQSHQRGLIPNLQARIVAAEADAIQEDSEWDDDC